MHQQIARSLTLTFLFVIGCAVDPGVPDESVASATAAVFAPCTTGTWCIEPPPVTTAPIMRSVWAISASDVFAVGDGGAIWRRSPTAWTAMASGTTADLRGVWGASSSDVWAVGLGGKILRFNGTAWSAVTGVTTSDLGAVWGASANDVWFGVGGTMLHWNGTAFSTSTSFTGHVLSISGTGANDVWATGESASVHHFTGTWQPVINPGIGTTTFFAVLSVAVGDVWVSDFVPGKETVHFSGGHWAPQKTTPASTAFESLVGFAANDIWGAGTSSRIAHWNGTAWGAAITLVPATTPTLWSITKAPSNLWVVGDNGVIGHQPL